MQLHCTGTVGGDHCPITAGSTLQFHSHRQLAPDYWQATSTKRCWGVQAPAQAVPEWLAEAQPCSPSVLQVQPEWVPAGAENGGGGTGHHGTVVLSTAPAGALRATAAGHYAPADLMIFLDVLLALDIDCHPLTSHSILSIERRCAAIYHLLPSSAHQAVKLLREQQKCWFAIKLRTYRICFLAVPQFCPFS